MLEECVKFLKVDIELGEGLWKRFGADGTLSIAQREEDELDTSKRSLGIEK